MAKQASGSVLVTYGETSCTCCKYGESGQLMPNRGFFPLTIDYREKFYASGKIPGGFFKREARPSEKEIIGCRLTDRPLSAHYSQKVFIMRHRFLLAYYPLMEKIMAIYWVQLALLHL